MCKYNSIHFSVFKQANNVFPRIVSKETILFESVNCRKFDWLPQISIFYLINWLFAAETIQGQKLFVWTVKFVLNLVLSTLFLSVKWSTAQNLRQNCQSRWYIFFTKTSLLVKKHLPHVTFFLPVLRTWKKITTKAKINIQYSTLKLCHIQIGWWGAEESWNEMNFVNFDYLWYSITVLHYKMGPH